MKRSNFAILWIAIVSTVLVASTTSAAKTPITVMLIDGQSGGPYHNWQLTTPVLKKELEVTGLFLVTVVTAPESGADFSNFKPKFNEYQVIVLNYDAPDWPADLRSQFENYIKSGGGLVIVHAADNAFPNWPAFNQMTGVGGWRGRNETSGPMWYFKDDKLVSDPSPAPPAPTVTAFPSRSRLARPSTRS